MSEIEAQYRRLLRWYPPQWRARNEAAVLGMLLDQAEHSARSNASIADRASLILGGLHERLLRPARPAGYSVVALGLAIAFTAWYLAVVAQAFAHPTLMTLATLVLALAAGLAKRAALATTLSVVAALAAIALALTVDGPGPSATAIIAGLALIGAVRELDRGQLVMLIAAVMLATISAEAWRSLSQLWPLAMLPQFWIALVTGSVGGLCAALLTAITGLRRVTAGRNAAA